MSDERNLDGHFSPVTSRPTLAQRVVGRAFRAVRRYRIDVEGGDGLPVGATVFCVNHSNSWDLFTTCEVLSSMGRASCMLVASDDLTPLTTALFKLMGGILFDRRDRGEARSAVTRMEEALARGRDVVVFGEGTWNLHPHRPMQNVRPGAAVAAATVGAKLVPTIFEYVEVHELCRRESELYERCVVRFGRPMDTHGNPVEQANAIRRAMERMRVALWEELGVDRSGDAEWFAELYLNHTYLKKFGVFGFTYDSESEVQFIYFGPDEPRENEFRRAPGGGLEPGVTPRTWANPCGREASNSTGLPPFPQSVSFHEIGP